MTSMLLVSELRDSSIPEDLLNSWYASGIVQGTERSYPSFKAHLPYYWDRYVNTLANF